MDVLLIFFLAINAITLVLYGVDKRRAKRKERRIPERILLGLAILGGAAGAYLGMRLYRHKIRKTKFRYGIPFVLIAQILVVLCLKCLKLE